MSPAVRARVLRLIEEKCVFRSPEYAITSPSGKPLSWIVDTRQVMFTAEGMRAFAEAFWEEYADRHPLQVGGLEIGAVPLVCAVVLEGERRGLPTNGFAIRKERKGYGLARQIEGRLDEHPIVLIDDIFNSGSSLDKARQAVEDAGRHVWEVFVVMSFESQAGAAWQRRYGIPVNFVASPGELGLKMGGDESVVSEIRFRNLWTYRAKEYSPVHIVPKSAPTVSQGRLYVGSDAGILRCFHCASGAVEWEFAVSDSTGKGIWSTPCVNDENVFVGAYGGNVYAFDKNSGVLRWKFIEADWVGSSPCLAEEHGLVAIGLEHAKPGAKGGLAGLDIRSGAKKWEVSCEEFIHGSACYSPRFTSFFVGTNSNELISVDVSGKENWRFLAHGEIKHAPSVDERLGLIVFGSYDNNIYVVDAVTGEKKFVVQTGNVVCATPLILGEVAIVGSTDKNLYVISLRDGQVVRKIELGAKIFASAAHIRDTVVVGSTDGFVSILDPSSWNILGRLALDAPITNRVAYCDATDTVIAVTVRNSVHAFKVKFPQQAELSSKETLFVPTEFLSPVGLARETLRAALCEKRIPRAGLEAGDDFIRCGGVFVSIREETCGRRLGRAGFWRLPGDETPVERMLVRATLRAADRAGLADEVGLGKLSLGVAMLGELVKVNPAELDCSAMGLVVFSQSGDGKIGGALPNSPEFADECGQYAHALRDAGLSSSDRYCLFTHSVERFSDSPTRWPRYGVAVPEPWRNDIELGNLLAGCVAEGCDSTSSLEACLRYFESHFSRRVVEDFVVVLTVPGDAYPRSIVCGGVTPRDVLTALKFHGNRYVTAEARRQFAISILYDPMSLPLETKTLRAKYRVARYALSYRALDEDVFEVPLAALARYGNESKIHDALALLIDQGKVACLTLHECAAWLVRDMEVRSWQRGVPMATAAEEPGYRRKCILALEWLSESLLLEGREFSSEDMEGRCSESSSEWRSGFLFRQLVGYARRKLGFAQTDVCQEQEKNEELTAMLSAVADYAALSGIPLWGCIRSWSREIDGAGIETSDRTIERIFVDLMRLHRAGTRLAMREYLSPVVARVNSMIDDDLDGCIIAVSAASILCMNGYEPAWCSLSELDSRLAMLQNRKHGCFNIPHAQGASLFAQTLRVMSLHVLRFCSAIRGKHFSADLTARTNQGVAFIALHQVDVFLAEVVAGKKLIPGAFRSSLSSFETSMTSAACALSVFLPMLSAPGILGGSGNVERSSQNLFQ